MIIFCLGRDLTHRCQWDTSEQAETIVNCRLISLIGHYRHWHVCLRTPAATEVEQFKCKHNVQLIIGLILVWTLREDERRSRLQQGRVPKKGQTNGLRMFPLAHFLNQMADSACLSRPRPAWRACKAQSTSGSTGIRTLAIAKCKCRQCRDIF